MRWRYLRTGLAFLGLLWCIWVAGCNMPVPSRATPTLNPTQVLETVVAEVTQMSVKTVQVSQTTTPSAQTPLPTATLSRPANTQLPTDAPVPCEMAAAGKPIDVTVPDGAQFEPGARFTKTWRLTNVGSCAWTRDYAVFWFSGEDMATVRSQTFLSTVQPGQSVDISIDMIAPAKPGEYQSNWKLRNPQGQFFGIGPSSGSPFWVRILVVQAATQTPTPTTRPTVTLTPQVQSSGVIALVVYDSFDLDTGAVNSDSGPDLLFDLDNEGNYILLPANGAAFGVPSRANPTFNACRSEALKSLSLQLKAIPDGSYLCARTDNGLPGFIRLALAELDNGLMTVEYTTWSIP